MTQGKEEGLIVFRRGRIIYAATSSVRESLGSLLLSRDLITEAELVEALLRQSESPEERRLGSFLLEMGLLSAEALGEVVREQLSRVISEFVDWNSGQFTFDVLELEDHGEVEVDAAELAASSGMSSTGILLEAARRADELRSAAIKAAGRAKRPYLVTASGKIGGSDTGAASPAAGSASLSSVLNAISSPRLGGETTARLLEVARGFCERCLLFSALRDHFREIGQFGLEARDNSDSAGSTGLTFPRGVPSLLSRTAEKKEPVVAVLPDTEGDARLLEALGGPADGPSIALPLIVDGEVMLVLYGDRLAANLELGWFEELERSIADVASTIQGRLNNEAVDDSLEAPTGA
jgi:hypothetical protein